MCLKQKCQQLLVFLWPIFHPHPIPLSIMCLEGENVLPCRDHGLAGAYCGRHHHPDVQMHSIGGGGDGYKAILVLTI